MKRPDPILALHLYPELLNHLIQVLESLPREDWQRPTPCPGWTVHDIATHLLQVDVGVLSRDRDQFYASLINARDWKQLVDALNSSNERWVQAMRGISPRLLCELLRYTGEQVYEYLASLDLMKKGPTVSWVSDEPVQTWLDIAREYTERWHHQQQIREAVDSPLLKQPRFFAPVLGTFVHGLPKTYRDVEAEPGTAVQLEILGDAGGRWFIYRKRKRWGLYTEVDAAPSAGLEIDQIDAWKLFTKSEKPVSLQPRLRVSGDQRLALKILDAVSIIA